MKGKDAMPEETVPVESTDTPPSGRTVRVVKQKRSIWDDRLVRIMGAASGAMVLLFLLVIVFALYFGFIGSKVPRTSSERDIIVWEAVAKQDSATVDQVQTYVMMLIADEQYVKAQQTIDAYKDVEEFDLTRGQNFLYIQGELYRAKGETDQALVALTEAMDLMEEAYQKEYEEGPELQNWAVAWGRHENYYLAALSRAAIYTEREEWESALEMFDLYLGKYPNEAEVLAQRGDVKAQLGDNEGAEADYRKALRFIADLDIALKGLEKIGAGE